MEEYKRHCELLKTGCTTWMWKYSRSCVDKEFAAAEKLGIRLCFGRGSLDLGPEDGNNISPDLIQTVDEIIADSEEAIKKYHDVSFN